MVANLTFPGKGEQLYDMIPATRFLIATALLATGLSCAGGYTPRAEIAAAEPGLAHAIASADSLISAAIGTSMPGAVFLVAKDGRVVHERAFGHAQINDYSGHRLGAPPAMRTSTLFDLASVTKVMATTFAVMLLADRGRIDLDAPVWRYLPDFRGPHLDSITVRHLLQHSSGLVQWQPLYYHSANGAQTYRVIRDMPLGWGVGDARHYSDLGFMLLGYIIERVSGQPLDRFLENELYRPLGLNSTTFNPRARGFTQFAATEQGNVYERHMVYDSTFGYDYRGDPTAWNGWRHYVLNGEVDDGNAFYANGGVAGHAGLFSTAADLRVLLDLLSNRGNYHGRQYIRAATVDRFLTRDKYENYLGWQSPRDLPEGSFSHTGFTGIYVLGVPKYRLSIVLLTNRQNMGPDARGYFPDLGPLQRAISKAIVNGSGG
ncbi:MAG TPA: serine hydrolase [Gemmatimonadaceae bacterium]|nr:serine hydrolase [Gemmatimonadaceae bacterium]